MCIVAIANRTSSRYRLIVAANRDERHLRPSAPADWWDGPGSLLAGRDLEAGGTWLGITGSGRFAAVTNIFEAGAPAAERSRGELVTGFLNGSAAPSAFAESLAADAHRYGPFNLTLFDGSELQFVSNRHPAAALGAGIHVFSNNAPGMRWAKVATLDRALDCAAEREDIQAFLIEALSGPKARGPVEQASDSPFVVGDDFGTRCTTVLTIDAAGRATFVEQRFVAGGEADDRSEFAFTVTP